MEILSVLKANIKSKKSTMTSLFILLFLISFSLITIISINKNAGRRYEEASNKANVPDITVLIKENLIPEDYSNRLLNDPAVDNIEIVSKIFIDEFEVNGKIFSEIHDVGIGNNDSPSYEIYEDDSFSLSKDSASPPNPGEIYIPIGCKLRYQCDLGDIITYTVDNQQFSFTIAKFIEESFSGCALMGMKQVFINSRDYYSLESTRNVNDKEFHIYFSENNEEHSDNILRRLSINEKLSDISSFTLTRQDSKMFTMIFTNILSGILWAFSLLLLIIVGIIIGFNINMSLEMEYHNIGILKSLGFTSFKIRSILLLQYLLCGGTGCIIGLLLSGMGTRYLSQYFVPVTGLFISDKTDIKNGSILITVSLVLLTVFILLKTSKVNKIYPISAITGDIYNGFSKKRGIYNISHNLRGSLCMRLVIQTLVNKFRQYSSLSIIIGMLLFFLIATVSVKQIKNYENVSSMFGGSSGEIQLIFHEEIDENIVTSVSKYIENITHVNKVFKSDIQYIGINGLQYLGNVVDSKNILKKPVQGREPNSDNEIIITETLSAILEKGIGDSVTLSHNQTEKDYTIVGLNQDTSDVGKCFGILEKGVQRLDSSYKIKKVDISIEDKENTSSIIEQLQENFPIDSTFQINNQYQNILDQSKFIIIAVNSITTLIYILALFFVAVITYIICCRIFISERTTMGILKSLGFTTKNIRLQFILRFAVISIFGSIIGLLFNFLLGRNLTEALLSGIGMERIVMDFSVIDYIIPMLFVCLTVTVSSYLSSSEINKVTPMDLIDL